MILNHSPEEYKDWVDTFNWLNSRYSRIYNVKEEGGAMEQVDIDYLQDRDATVVALDVKIGARIYSATGSSKREPGDPFKPEVGKKLALARALANLSEVLADSEGYTFGRAA